MKTFAPGMALLAMSLSAQQYEAKSLGVLPGYVGAEATAINNKGYVVGYAFGRDQGNEAAFLYDPMPCETYNLGSLGGGTARATGINDYGLAVGYSKNASGLTRAFGYSHGVMYDLGGPQPSEERAFSVNNSGKAAGAEVTPGGNDPGSAVTFAAGQVNYLPLFQGDRVLQATAINEFDQLTGFQIGPGEITGLIHFPNLVYPPDYGWFRIRPVTADARIPGLDLAMMPSAINRYGVVTGSAGLFTKHAFLSKFFFEPTIDLGTLNPADPGVTSVGLGLNNSNRVVGFSEKTPGGGPVAFLHDGTKMMDLNTLLVNPAGWELMSANAINDNGQIVGTGRYQGQQVAFLLNPATKYPPPPCTPGKK
jgi:probable HAF family extracellular repeat protein